MKQNCGSYHKNKYQQLYKIYKPSDMINIFHDFDRLCQRERQLNDDYDYTKWKDQEAIVYIDFIFDFLSRFKRRSKNYIGVLLLIRIRNHSELIEYIDLDDRFDKFR